MFPKHLYELNPGFFWSLCCLNLSAVEQRHASFLNPPHGNYQLGVCVRSQATQTCHVQLLEETAQCCLRISWTPVPRSLFPSHSHSPSSRCLLCSHHVWGAATRSLARLKVSGRLADVQIVLIPSTKVFLNSGSPSQTMNNAGFVCDMPAPQRRLVPRLESGNSAPTWLTNELQVVSVLAHETKMSWESVWGWI